MTSVDLLKKIDHKTGCILWITDGNIDYSLKHYSSIDYLLDGLLSSSGHLEFKTPTSFYTKSFHSNIWIFHINPEAHKGNIDEQFALLKEKLNDQKIVVIDETKNNFSVDILKRYGSFQFEVI